MNSFDGRISPLLDYGRADFCPVVQVNHVVIGHANAARGDAATELPRLVRPMDAVMRGAEIQRARNERIVRTAIHMMGEVGKAR